MSKLLTVIELLHSASVDVKEKYEVLILGQNAEVKKEWESREQHLEVLIKTAQQLLEEYEDEEQTVGEVLSFTVTKLSFKCGTVKYALQAYSDHADELEFGMFDTKHEAFKRKSYYTRKDADYAELDIDVEYTTDHITITDLILAEQVRGLI